MGVRYTKALDQVGDERVCTVVMEKGGTRSYKDFKEAQIYYADEDAFNRMYEKLCTNQFFPTKLPDSR